MRKCMALLVIAVVAVAAAPATGQAAGDVPANVPREGLVAFWTADGHAKDGVGENHGTLGGGAAFAPGKRGKAFKFDGKDDYVAMGDVLDWGSGSWSVGLWYRRTVPGTKSTALLRKGMSVYGTPKVTGYGLILKNNMLQFVVGSPSDDAKYTAQTKEPPAEKWHHVFGVLDRKASKIHLYVDGRLAATQSVPNLRNVDTNMSLALGILLDRGKSGARTTPFGGAIDDVAIWNRALSAAEARAVFRGLPAGVPQVTRKADADRVVLKDGNILLGTIESKSYIAATSFGKLEIPAKDVVGLVGADKRTALPRLILTDGQVVAGKLAGRTVQLVLPATGSTLRVPVERIRELSYRISEDKPAEGVSPGPMVALSNGNRLAWTEMKHELQLVTSYATVDLPTGAIVAIEPGGKTPRGRRVQLANGSVLTGALLPTRLKLKLKLGPIAEVHDVQLVGLTGPAEPVVPAGGATMVMRNDDRLLGRILDKTLALKSALGAAKIPVAGMLKIEFDAARADTVTVKTWGGGVMKAQLVEPVVTFAIAPNGPTVKAKSQQIVSITRSVASPPAEILERIEKLIAQLGAESYLDRQKAQKELIAMGKSIVPLLKKYLTEARDPEIRQRLEVIIEALGG